MINERPFSGAVLCLLAHEVLFSVPHIFSLYEVPFSVYDSVTLHEMFSKVPFSVYDSNDVSVADVVGVGALGDAVGVNLSAHMHVAKDALLGTCEVG